jgi:hypothetical protein
MMGESIIVLWNIDVVATWHEHTASASAYGSKPGHKWHDVDEAVEELAATCRDTRAINRHFRGSC